MNMRMYRAMVWFEIPAIDKGDAEAKAKKLMRKKGLKELKPVLYSIEEG